MIPFTNINNTHNTKWKPKLKKSEQYIYRLPIKTSARFYKVARGVGSKIYEYLKWKKEMNGNKFISLPNDYFYKTWEIRRQRICDAVDKLKAAKLIKVRKKTGKSTLVILNEPKI